MNEKEVAQIRRRFRFDKTNITSVRGCYVNEKREIVSEFEQSLHTASQEESENILATLKRTVSGTFGKNLIDITFETNQVMHAEQHQLLMRLRNQRLKEQESVQAFYQKVIESVDLQGDYLILLAHDTYDIPYHAKDGEKLEDASSEVFSYILCSICPVRMTKPALSYRISENQFQNSRADWLVAAPEMGFLFPAFDDQSTNIYGALYYCRSLNNSHPDFVDAIFHCNLPMPAQTQKECFQRILEDTLAEDCSFDVVETVHERLSDMISEHKQRKEEQPLALSQQTVADVLSDCGISQARLQAFTEKYEQTFGEDASISPENLIDNKKFHISTPDVSIQVAPEHSDLIQTRMIDGKKYILIRADAGVQVNGVNIHIAT